MKTLKQILQKYCDMPDYYRYQNETSAFKEWLQQKQKNVSQISMRFEVYKELLEELQQ